mmetsp:Transcript_144176/g.262219  ORF Transcript_144176/g.262219 Transcript_144176/m.262219 type:complete len:86 (-) Transcript_144176:78-335(-)
MNNPQERNAMLHNQKKTKRSVPLEDGNMLKFALAVKAPQSTAKIEAYVTYHEPNIARLPTPSIRKLSRTLVSFSVINSLIIVFCV